MPVFTVYSRIYARCLAEALAAIQKNVWTLILPVLVILAFLFLAQIAGNFGMAGGIVMALGRAAIFSGYLYFLGEVVGGAKVSLADLKTSIGAYFWSLVNLFFVLWIANFLLGSIARGAQGATLMFVINLVLLIALNAAPEVIYQRGTHGGIATIKESFEFLQQNWLEWIVPNLPLFLVGYAVWWASLRLSGVASIVLLIAVGAFLHVGMVFRGRVFAALVGSSHRQRMFKYRND